MRDANNEEVMRRFLLGDATAQERDGIEQRMIEDADYFHALAGLEDEMALACADDPNLAWRDAFARAPERREQIERMRAFRETLAAQSLATVPTPHASTRLPLGDFWRIAAGIAVILAGTAAFLMVRSADAPSRPQETAVDRREAPPAPVAFVTFRLAAAATRSEGASNTFRVPSGTKQVLLQFNASPVRAGALRTQLRTVDGVPRDITSTPTIEVTGETANVSWLVPADKLAIGDYFVTLHAPSAADPVATRFFSIVE